MKKINLTSLSLDGVEINIPGVFELVSNPDHWTKEKYESPEFLDQYERYATKSEVGNHVTVYKLKENSNEGAAEINK